MPSRLLQSEIASFVETALANVKSGLESAMAAGIIVEMPAKMDFDLDVVIPESYRTQRTNSTGTEAGSEDSSGSESGNNTEASTETGSSSHTDLGQDSAHTIRAYNSYRTA